MFRSPSLLARFGIVSALLLATAGLALAQILTSAIESRAREQAEYIAVVAIRMGVAPRLEPADFANGEVQKRDEQFLDQEMTASLTEEDSYQPLRLKVYNAARMVIYSDQHALIGDTHDSANLRAAVDGELVSKTSLLNDLDEVEGKTFDPEALEVYVPLTYGGDEVVGVAELYLPYAPIEQAIAEDTRTLYTALAAALLLFYVLMFRMVARASRRLLQQATELRSGAKRHEYLANHDLLTQLPNRALLIDRLERAVIEARRHGTDVAVLLLDLDRFKEVNDTLGHETGDALLCLVGERIGKELRAMDTVARVGGDEFVVLLPHVDSQAAAMLVAERVLDALHRPFYVDGIELAVEASVGIACYPDHGEDQGSLLKHADVAMYVAKEARGTFAVYDAQSDTSSLSRTTLLTELRRALDEHELVLYYQPTNRLSDGAVRSVEALVRWNHPTRGLVPSRTTSFRWPSRPG
jgi:diguanylate cyclase (GGDEF)-like protein